MTINIQQKVWLSKHKVSGSIPWKGIQS